MAIRKKDAFLRELNATANLRQGSSRDISQGAINLTQNRDNRVRPGPMFLDHFIHQAEKIQILIFVIHKFSFAARS